MTTDTFALKLTGPGMSIDQVVSREIATQIMIFVLSGGKTGAEATTGTTAGAAIKLGAGAAATNVGKSPSMREYLTSQNAKRIPQQIATIGNYYSVYQSKSTFTRQELEKGFEDAKEPIPSNMPRDINVAITNGWIAPQPGQKNLYYVTSTGSSAVDSKFTGKATGRRRRRPRKAQKKVGTK